MTKGHLQVRFLPLGGFQGEKLSGLVAKFGILPG